MPAPGLRLGRWTLVRRIARGGMAAIWVAWRRRRRGGREVAAIKIILPHLAVERAFLRMFFDEVRLLGGIRHPNVVRVRDLGVHERLPYVVLEWVHGDSLAAVLASLGDSRMPRPIAVHIVAQCCLGLDAAHDLRGEDGELLGVVHRDVSPPNILLAADGEVKLIDFGVAKAADRLAEQTRTGVIKGKIAYMSPEQALRGVVDRRSDVWALGVVLYELVAGTSPFEGGLVDVFAQIKNGTSPRALPDEVPRELEEVIERALCHDPSERYQSAKELHHALRAASTADGRQPATEREVSEFARESLAGSIAEREAEMSEALSAPGLDDE